MSDIRPVQQSDLPALLEIYNHYVLHTPVTFDVEPRTLAQRQEWLDGFAATGRYRCFVAVEGDAPIGWVCSMRYKEKEAYATTVETSIYLAPAATGRGLGKRMYSTLFDALKGEDIHRAYGGVTLPNEASARLHRACGFRDVGTYDRIGRKFGTFWDVAHFLREMP